MSMTVWRGPSEIDGKSIKMVFWGPSKNRKTGPLHQTGIYVDNDKSPTDNIKSSDDVSVCGSCPFRGFNGCNANQRYFKQTAKGKGGEIAPEELRYYQKRNPFYGELTAVPYDVAKLGMSRKDRGYTHRWAVCDQRYRDHLMASCDTQEEQELALAMGWRVFRVVRDGDAIPENATHCPYDEMTDRGHPRPLQCKDCNLCDGKQAKHSKRADVVWVHRKLNVLAKLKIRKHGEMPPSFGGLDETEGKRRLAELRA